MWEFIINLPFISFSPIKNSHIVYLNIMRHHHINLKLSRYSFIHWFYRLIPFSHHRQPLILCWGPTKHTQPMCLLTYNVINQYMYVMIIQINITRIIKVMFFLFVGIKDNIKYFFIITHTSCLTNRTKLP